MKIKAYLLDHLPHTIFWILGLLLLDVGLWLLPDYPVPLAYLFYLDSILTVLYIIFLIVVYFYRSRWYQGLTMHHELKAEALDVPMDCAQNHTQAFIQTHINELLDYHHDQVNTLVQHQQDQQAFIESWVHDIKVPLAATKLLLETTATTLEKPTQQQLLEEWAKINHYVDQILYFSRLENFSNDYLLREYQLRKLTVQVVQENMTYFFQKHIHFNISDTELTVLTDEKWLQYSINQLISNALKYTPENGEISIILRQDNSGRYLDIQDNGVGIPAADLPRIFDKGFTGTNGRLANQHATGLGLYLAKQLCEKLGHHLSVQSEVGVGTTMTIQFPYLNYYNEDYSHEPLKPTSQARFESPKS